MNQHPEKENPLDLANQLLAELSIDPFQLEDFLTDPDAFLPQGQPSPAELLQHQATPEPVNGTPWVRCAAFFDPGIDPLPDPEVPVPSVADALTRPS